MSSIVHEQTYYIYIKLYSIKFTIILSYICVQISRVRVSFSIQRPFFFYLLLFCMYIELSNALISSMNSLSLSRVRLNVHDVRFTSVYVYTHANSAITKNRVVVRYECTRVCYAIAHDCTREFSCTQRRDIAAAAI